MKTFKELIVWRRTYIKLDGRLKTLFFFLLIIVGWIILSVRMSFTPLSLSCRNDTLGCKSTKVLLVEPIDALTFIFGFATFGIGSCRMIMHALCGWKCHWNFLIHHFVQVFEMDILGNKLILMLITNWLQVFNQGIWIISIQSSVWRIHHKQVSRKNKMRSNITFEIWD